MVKEYVILAIILVGLFLGCIGEEWITGKYVLEGRITRHILFFMKMDLLMSGF